MAREFNKKKTFRRTNKRDPLPEAKPFGKFTRKQSFDPNKDLDHGKESYSVRKRKNLLEENKKSSELFRKPYSKPDRQEKESANSERKPFGKKGFEKKSYERKPFEKKSSEKRPFEKKEFEKERSEKKSYERKPFEKKSSEKRSFERKPFEKKEFEKERSEKKSYERKPFEKKSSEKRPFERKPFEKKEFEKEPSEKKSFEKKPFEKKSSERPFKRGTYPNKLSGHSARGVGEAGYKKLSEAGYKKLSEQAKGLNDGLIRLNKYIANAGICSRREADELIRAGAVKVNGIVVTEMGYKVKADDSINYGGETLRKEKAVYVLLNKPKDFITTLDDPGKRKTVFDLVKNACRERIYPVGRLDRNTTGVLLLTNDGDLTKKLTHPKHGIKKIYQVTLDKPLGRPDLEEIAKNGITLEDGHIHPEAIDYVADGSNKKEVGLEIHSGRNRIVRRLFEHLGYEVIKLDRVVFAGLTKKDLPRGHWRLLTEQEVGFLKML
jgi:23S rRNA pseudouridine2605 synthase